MTAADCCLGLGTSLKFSIRSQDFILAQCEKPERELCNKPCDCARVIHGLLNMDLHWESWNPCLSLIPTFESGVER